MALSCDDSTVYTEKLFTQIFFLLNLLLYVGNNKFCK